MDKMWQGRFQKEIDTLMEDFNSSIGFDYKLYEYDINGSISHCKMLQKVDILTKDESDLIIDTLEKILIDVKNGKIQFSVKNEDIHMNIEAILTDRIGDLGKKLHTGRSRNDQVALDFRLYALDHSKIISNLLLTWIEALNNLAKEHKETILPGYTHLQRAQPINFAHFLLAHSEMAKRDYLKLKNYYELYNYCPLGAGALAGSTLPLDREFTSKELGFIAPTNNSLDSVSDRDFALELLSIISIGMMHLSRLCEELIIYSSSEFGFITLDDAFSTGSSMMPQKKNPDALELIRGKTGRCYGNLVSLLTTMKGLPLAYNKDMQEDKEGLFDSVETYENSLMIIVPILKTLTVNKDKMRLACNEGFTNATDLADYLVNKGVPFRDAHSIAGKLVYYALSNSLSLLNLSIDEFRSFCPLIEDDIYKAISIETCVNNRNTIGGPSINEVNRVIELNNEFISKYK